MLMAKEWLKTWICLSLLFACTRAARPRFDVSTDMGMVLVPADAEVDSAIFRLRATDQDADFPLLFEIIATTSPIVRVENLPCTLYNKVCQANVILTRRLVPGRLHDFVVRVRDSKGDVNSMQATISVTNATTQRDKIFPHIPALIMVPEDTKPEKELDYLLVESNPWSGKPVYIELWQPKELFKIRQRQMGSQTKGIITLIGELDFETQSMYTLTMYATDPYTEPGKDTRNIAGLHVVVVVQDVQDVPPVFTLAPPLTKINNTVKPGDVILRVHAEDGDKGVPRDVTYGLISEGNPFTPFFNVSETTGEIILARPLEELTKITHVGAPIVLKIVAEEIRTMRDEPPAQATVVELGLLLGEPGNSPPYFENDNYVAWLDENAEPGTIITFTDSYSTLVKDEDIGKAGVFALKLENNNGTFEISPAVAERSANFVITVRDNTLIDYEKFKSLRFKITAQEVGPATNLSTSVPVTIFLRDINDNPPVFDVPTYEVTLSENSNPGTRVVQVHATDNDAGIFGRIQYVKIEGMGREAFQINPDTGLITVSMGSVLDRELTPKLELTVEARDEEGRGLRGVASLIVNILDVNDNAPIFEKGIYEFLLNSELTNFTMPAFIKAVDADAEPPNNVVRYEIIHGNYENKFQLNEETGELMIREALSKSRKVRQNKAGNVTQNMRKMFRGFNEAKLRNETNLMPEPNSTIKSNSSISGFNDFHLLNNLTDVDLDSKNQSRRRRAEDSPLFILTARAYDLGVPHLANIAQIRIMRPMSMFARIVMFVMPGENPDPKKTAETLATITGSRVTIQEIKPYVPQLNIDSGSDLGKRSVVVARVEQNGPGTLVDVDKIRASLAENGFGIISGMEGIVSDSSATPGLESNPNISNSGKTTIKNVTLINSSNEDVTVYRTENKLLTWLLVLLGLLLLAAIITLILCCICPSCPFYMEPRKRRIHSSETLVIRSDGRPKRHVHRKPIKLSDGYSAGRKEAWSADPARQQHWQFNRRNTTSKNLGIASLPGDVVPGHRDPDTERLRRAASLRLHNGNATEPFGEHVMHQTRVIPMQPEDERIYMEDVEALGRSYERAEMDSLRRHEAERGSDRGPRVEPMTELGAGSVREQHFFREGNAEVLRLVTRGEIEDHKDYDRTKDLYHANGKDILLHRFIEDQKLRRSQDLRDSYHGSLHEADVDRSMESHHRVNEMPAEILIIPERLEMQRQPSYGQRQYQQDVLLKPDIQRLVVEGKGMLRMPVRDVEVTAGESSRNMRSSAENISGRDRNAPYTMHDTELVRQNALLTRLLLEKEGRGLNVPVADNSSFLETQSLPGQVAIATQTDRTTATQTEFFFKSRSDNEECDEDPRIRRKSKLKGRVETQEDFKKMKTIWVRTPIPEESRAQSGSKKATPTRTKIEVAESRNASISPDVLKEISNSQKSDNSEDNEEDAEDKLSEDQAEISSSKMQKVISKSISTSKKKIKEERIENDSSTPSPDTKEKVALMKGKNRKKVEKPPRAKKLEKSIESEKSHFMEPSFRVLEREISSFQQKIRQFGDKKLKKLKKDDKDVDKKDKESEDDIGIYDISKKCEVTVKKHTKKTISRESSPIKISVEQKTITSEEETSARERNIIKQRQENISSSDLDDDNLKRQSSTFSERTVQCETSKTQTRSRSLLRRQTNIEHSDTKSSSEKLDKSEDNDTKTDKSKESTSSLDAKMDTTSSSSRDFSKREKQMENVKTKKMPVSDKKSIPDEKIAVKSKPDQIVNIKRKISSLRSKIVNEPSKQGVKKDGKADKIKSITSDESKSTSPTKSKENLFVKKSTTSEDEKSSKEIKPKSSTSKESAMALEFDKFVKDVKGAVEKEISSITQAAKEALNINKSSISDGEKKDEKSKVSKKSKEFKDSQKLKDNSQKHMAGTSKQKVDAKVIDKEKASKSLDGKDKKDKLKDHKKMRSVESDSSANIKSDDAISFIVFENAKSIKSTKEIKATEDALSSESSKYPIHGKGSKDISENPDKSNEFMKVERKTSNNIQDTVSDVENVVDETKNSVKQEFDKAVTVISDSIQDTSKDVEESIDKTKQLVQGEIDLTKKKISEKIDDTKKAVSDKFSDTEKKVSKQINETKKAASEDIQKTKEIVSKKIDETKKTVSDEIEGTQKNVSERITETKRAVSQEIDETNQTVAATLDKTKQSVSDTIDSTKVFADKTIDQTKESVSATIDKTKKNVSSAVDETKETMSQEIDKSQKIITDKFNETKQTTSDVIHASMKDINDSVNKLKESALGVESQTTAFIDDKLVKAKSETMDNIHNENNTITEKIDKTNLNESKLIDITVKSPDNQLREAKKSVTDTIYDAKKAIEDGVDKTKDSISDGVSGTSGFVGDKAGETKTMISDAVRDSKKGVEDVLDKTQETMSDSIGATTNFVSDKVAKAETIVTDSVRDTKEVIHHAVGTTQKTVSDTVDGTSRFIRDNVREAEITATNTVNDVKEAVSDTITKTEETVSDAIHGTKDSATTVVDKTEEGISNIVEGTKKFVGDKIEKVKSSVSEFIDETKEIPSAVTDVNEKVKEVEKTTTDTIHDAKKTSTNIVETTEEGISNILDGTRKLIDDKVEKVKSSVSEFIDETKEIPSAATDISKKVDKVEKTATDTIHDAKETTTNIVKTTEDGIFDILDDTKKFIGDKFEKVKSSVSEFIDETKEIPPDAADVSKKLDEVEKITNDAKDSTTSIIHKTEAGMSNVIEDTKQFVGDTVEKVKSSVSEFMDETKEISSSATDVSKKVGEAEKTATGAMRDTKENVTSIIDQTEHGISNIVDGTKKFIDDKVEKVKSSVSEFIDETKETLPPASDEIENVVDNVDKSKQSATTLINENKKSSSDKVDDTTNSTRKSKKDIKDSVTKSEGITSVRKSAKEERKIAHQKSTDSESIASVSSASLPKDSKELKQSKLKDELDSSVAEITKELLEKEQMYANRMHEEVMKQQGNILSSKEQDDILKMPEAKQTKQNELPKDPKKDSTSSIGLKKDKKALLTDTSQLQGTKESKIHEKQQTDSKKSSRSSSSDKKSFREFSSKGQTNAGKLASTSASSKKKLASASSDTAGKSISSAEEDEKSSIKVSPPSQPEKPILEVTDATTGEEEGEASEDDSSSASDISSKTALRTRPYGTPRHSISSEGGGDSAETSGLGKSTATAKAEGKPRQRWGSEKSRDSRSKVETPQSGEYAKAIFPQKIEVTPMDKPKISAGKAPIDQPQAPKSVCKDCQETSKSTSHEETHVSETTENKQRTETTRTRSVIASVRKREHSRTDRFSRFAEAHRKSSPRREKAEAKSEDKKSQSSASEQRKVEIRSRHLKLHVSHHYRQAKDDASPSAEATSRDDKGAATRIPSPAKEREAAEAHGTGTSRTIDHGKDPEIANARSRYMAWYQQKRTEMERKRREKKEAEEEQQRPKWLRRATAKSRKAKSAEEPKEDHRAEDKGSRSRERAKSSTDAAQTTPQGSRKRVKPLVNVESEQLKAIVRQGRKLRKAEGGREEDPPVQIFVPEKPPAADPLESAMQLEPRHHLTQHSEYKYEKAMPTMPFYLHPPPPVPHSSPEHFQEDSSDSRRMDDDMDSGIAISTQGGTRLRHQQLLEKKSVFDIAYNEAAPGQLRSDSSTPPS